MATNKNYKYKLRNGRIKTTCPECGRARCFVPYVLADDGQTLAGEQYGRCERVNSCGYHRYPKEDRGIIGDYVAKPHIIVTEKKPVDFVPVEVVEATFTNYQKNNFVKFLISLFGQDAAFRAVEMYNIGTAKHGGTIFWQQDKDLNFRTGKAFYYDQTTGKREHSRGSWYVHKKINPDFNLEQVFFGEHLVADDKPIALVESEKTAVCMSIIDPSVTWIAAGGSEMINNQRLERLPRLDSVYPDDGQCEKWKSKTIRFNPYVYNEISTYVKEGVLKPGADIFDLRYIDIIKKQS